MAPNESDFAYIAANPPGGAQIPELSSLQQGLQRGMGGPPQLAGGAETDRAMENMRQFQATMASQNAAASRPPQPTEQTIKVDPDGNRTVSIKGPAELAEYYGKAGQFYQQALGGFAQQLSQVEQQTQQREQQMRSQPWVQLATALSANLAQAKDLPGWVQAMGRTAAQLNPTADELRNQRLGMIQQEATLAEKGAAIDVAALRTQLANIQKQASLSEKQSEDMTRIERDASIAARTRGEFDPDSYVAEMTARGQDPKIATASAQRLAGVAKLTENKLAALAAAKDATEAQKTKQFYDALTVNAERTDKLITAAAERQDKALAAAAARGETADAAKAAKIAEPAPVLRTQLANLNAADTALDEIEKLVSDPNNQSLFTGQGPVSGRIASGLAAAGRDPGGRIAGLKQQLGLQTAQAIKATGAGARGFGPQERPYFEQLAEGINRTPEQNLRIVQGWRTFLDQERRGIMVSNPDVAANPKYAGVWGKRLAPAPQEADPGVWTKEKIDAIRKQASGGR